MTILKFSSFYLNNIAHDSTKLNLTQLNSTQFNQTEPNFVGSFEIGEYVYFFFRESAVEYINCGKSIYSRVARVCKVSYSFGLSFNIFSFSLFLFAPRYWKTSLTYLLRFDKLNDEPLLTH